MPEIGESFLQLLDEVFITRFCLQDPVLEHKCSYPARTEPARNCCPFELNGEVVEDASWADNHSGPGSDGRICEIRRQGWPRNIAHDLDTKRRGEKGLWSPQLKAQMVPRHHEAQL